MDTTFIPYEPGQPAYAPRRTNEEWESWKVLITSWHNEGLSRQQMCGILFEHGFRIKHGQLVRKMTEWNLMARNKSEPSPQSSVSGSSDGAKSSSSTIPVPTGTNTSDKAVVVSNDLDLNSTTAEDVPQTRVRSVPEKSNHESCTAITKSEDFPFSISMNVSSNLGGVEARARILQKMEAAESAFPALECCCGDFFKPDKGFTRLKPLYQMLMDETESVQSLHYVRALACLCRSSVLSEAMKSKLESTLQYYTELLRRPSIRNDAAYAIALQLANIRDGIAEPEDRAGLKVTMEFFENEDAYQSVSKNLRDKYSHLYHGLRNLSILDLRSSADPNDWVDNRDEHRQLIDEQLLGGQRADGVHPTIQDCRDVIQDLRNLLDLSEYASRLKPWSFHEGHTHARAHFERTNTIKLAQQISEVLISNVQYISWPEGWHRSEALVATVFDAIGLIVAQEFHERGRLRGLPNDDIPTRLAAATSVLVAEGTSWAERQPTLLSISRRLSQAIWICDSKQALFAPQGLHIGPCRAKKCWDLLGQSVKQFDRTTTLVAPTALPRNLEPQASDDVSMFSSSTKSSFQRFRRLSDRLKHRSSSSTAGSVRSKWSGHMSVDSWTPEKVLGVEPEQLGPTLPVEEHRRLDEEAFMSMQSIRV